MKKSRIICLVYIVVAAVFASFFGGSFSYALFYAGLAVPAVCFLYVFFVFARLKIYQTIDSKIVVKGEKTGYNYILSNETGVYFTSITTEFISDYSKVDLVALKGGNGEISLSPGQRSENKTELVCLYRGEYKVGVKAVIIKDYLGLFTLRRKYPSTMNIRVYPRVVKLGSLAALNFGTDVKSLPFSVKPGEELDSDLRAFAFGDSVRAVNWKVSAKRGELLTRRRTQPPKESIAIYIDTALIHGEKKIPTEDRILEAALSIADFYLERKVGVEMIYCSPALCRSRINTTEDFGWFYDACINLQFIRNDTSEFLENINLGNASALIVITARERPFLSRLMSLSAELKTCVILTGNRESGELSRIRESLGKTALVHIPDDAEIGNILERGN
ncbi:MAG: DUF58 domain-containing protein [Oscillospiraceae bacterium]|nr:DUF58 domain-containing protein [Oscillospiraceae bacterium]